MRIPIETYRLPNGLHVLHITAHGSGANVLQETRRTVQIENAGAPQARRLTDEEYDAAEHETDPGALHDEGVVVRPVDDDSVVVQQRLARILQVRELVDRNVILQLAVDRHPAKQCDRLAVR